VGPSKGAEDLAAVGVGDDAEGVLGFGVEVGFVPERLLDFRQQRWKSGGGFGLVQFADCDLGGHENRQSTAHS